MAKKHKAVCYVVRLEGRCPAWVLAESWEEATVKAAEFWGIPWGANVCDMWLESTKEARKNLCLRCGRIIYGERELCEACEQSRRDDREETAQRMKRTWYLGRKHTSTCGRWR